MTQLPVIRLPTTDLAFSTSPTIPVKQMTYHSQIPRFCCVSKTCLRNTNPLWCEMCICLMNLWKEIQAGLTTHGSPGWTDFLYKFHHHYILLNLLVWEKLTRPWKPTFYNEFTRLLSSSIPSLATKKCIRIVWFVRLPEIQEHHSSILLRY